MDSAPAWPLVAYLVAIGLLTAAVIALSAILGERHKERATDQPFESGILPTGSARLDFSAKFYLIAMFFVIFDLEAVFIFAWAVDVPELGWSGYWEILFFIAILVASLIYLWRLGALDWSPQEARNSHIRKQDESLQTRI